MKTNILNKSILVFYKNSSKNNENIAIFSTLQKSFLGYSSCVIQDIYIYIYIEREREMVDFGESDKIIYICMCVCVCMCACVAGIFR